MKNSKIIVLVLMGVIVAAVVVAFVFFPAEDVSSRRPVDAAGFVNKYGKRMAGIRCPKILIIKSERVLVFYSSEKEYESFRVGLGFCPAGHKEREGDGRTPEGEYYICTKNPRSRYYLSIGISYPCIKDADRGLADGQITRAEHKRIVSAIRARRQPPWKTALGGEIFIHGKGAGSDWTLGCIALENGDMKYLYEKTRIGTPVVILP
jgi:murein L,D-transpeptidase YafK